MDMWHKLWLEATFELPLQLRIGMRFLCLHWYRLPFNSSMPECRNIQELPSATFSALLILVVGCTILSVFFTVCATTTKFVYVPPASQPTPVVSPAPFFRARFPTPVLHLTFICELIHEKCMLPACCCLVARLLACLAAWQLVLLLFDFCAFCLLLLLLPWLLAFCHCSVFGVWSLELGAWCSEQGPNEEKPATINRCRHLALHSFTKLKMRMGM